MSLPNPLTPAVFSDLDGAPGEELAQLVGRAAREANEATLASLTGLLVDRALNFVREGSRDDLLEEALAVSGGISGDAGDALRERDPETFGAWSALDRLLAEAGRRSDPAAVKSILLSGRGKEILELLATEKHRPVPRAEIRQRLNLGEAQLSHLLRDLEEADLILRYREEGNREVLVELGRVGREYVGESILPDWIERLAKAKEELASGVCITPSELARELVKAGAPSEAAAHQLAAIVAAPPAPIVTVEVGVKSAKILRFVQGVRSLPADASHFQETEPAADAGGAGGLWSTKLAATG